MIHRPETVGTTDERKAKKARNDTPQDSSDLLAAVVGGDIQRSSEEMQKIAAMLRDEFVQPMKDNKEWSILFPEARSLHNKLFTYIDTERDPIIAELRSWVTIRLGGGDDLSSAPMAPTYPASRVADGRSPPLIPPHLCFVEPLIGLQTFKRDRFFAVYLNRMIDMTDNSLFFNHLVPHLERIRQWKRITNGTNRLPFRDIVRCLGWRRVEPEVLLMLSLTEWLMLQRPEPQPKSKWLTKEKVNMWHFNICLAEMRSAAIFIEQLKVRNANVNNIHNLMRRKELVPPS